MNCTADCVSMLPSISAPEAQLVFSVSDGTRAAHRLDGSDLGECRWPAPQQWCHRGNGRAHARDTCISRFCVVALGPALSPSSQTARFISSNCSHCLRKLCLHFGASLFSVGSLVFDRHHWSHTRLSHHKEESRL